MREPRIPIWKVDWVLDLDGRETSELALWYGPHVISTLPDAGRRTNAEQAAWIATELVKSLNDEAGYGPDELSGTLDRCAKLITEEAKKHVQSTRTFEIAMKGGLVDLTSSEAALFLEAAVMQYGASDLQIEVKDVS